MEDPDNGVRGETENGRFIHCINTHTHKSADKEEEFTHFSLIIENNHVMMWKTFIIFQEEFGGSFHLQVTASVFQSVILFFPSVILCRHSKRCRN